MSLGITELIVILVIVFVLFGAGKLPGVMRDLGSGMKSFKEGMREDKDKIGRKDDQDAG